jgi:DNA-binding transcriptional ArsR family regulator
MNPPKLSWDWGTAYDFFLSLLVLHEPDQFALRGAWAAGVRSRLPAESREFLQDARPLALQWLYALPHPKDSTAVLNALAAISPVQRLFDTVLVGHPPEIIAHTREVAARGEWGQEDVRAISQMFVAMKEKPKEKEIVQVLGWATAPEAFGDAYLTALEHYREVFFAEEEARIAPVLEQAVERAQRQAELLPLPELLESLSQGIRFVQPVDKEELILVPVFWTTPLIIEEHITPGRQLFLWGARPPEMSLVPGEVVPALMHQALKALADPTRLRILRYLAEEPLTPTDLAHRLRLRAPTVVHHLHTLRLARLVYLTLEEGVERRYALRYEAVVDNLDTLKEFLQGNATSDDGRRTTDDS